jgi:hypothetical protein
MGHLPVRLAGSEEVGRWLATVEVSGGDALARWRTARRGEELGATARTRARGAARGRERGAWRGAGAGVAQLVRAEAHGRSGGTALWPARRWRAREEEKCGRRGWRAGRRDAAQRREWSGAAEAEERRSGGAAEQHWQEQSEEGVGREEKNQRAGQLARAPGRVAPA